MTPAVPQVLALLADVLQEQVLDELAPGSYGAQSVQRSATLLQAAAEAFECAAASRVDEWRARGELFGDAAAVVDDPPLQARLKAAAAEPLPGDASQWRMSALDARLAPRAALLIDLQVWCEAQAAASGTAIDRIEAAIWRELRAGTERRRSSIDRF